MTAEDPIVTVRALNHWFGSGDARKQALENITLQLPRGSFTVLMGPSGSGKTTLLTLIGCLRSVQDGSVRLLGHELNGADDHALTRLRHRLGFIFQAHNLHRSLTAAQNVQMGLQVHGKYSKAQMRARAVAMLEEVGLGDRIDYYPDSLSGGQKQRVAIARALVAHPAIVLADEPTAALDSKSGRDVVNLMQKLAKEQGSTILLVTHDNRILDIADRLVHLEDGRLVTNKQNGQAA